MNPQEYAKLSEIESRHWFYSGKREIVRHWLKRTHPLARDCKLLDVGAGTGKFVEDMSGECQAIAMDDHAESLDIARSRLRPEQIVEGRCTDLPFGNDSVDVVTALDVLEHVEDDVRAVAEIARVLKPRGACVITVPALPALWSDWDEALHHFRRYTKDSLERLLANPSLELQHCAYINVAALPAVWFVRKWRGLRNHTGAARSEDAIPPEPFNSVLRKVFVGLACQTAVSFPAGVGLLAVLQKKNGEAESSREC